MRRFSDKIGNDWVALEVARPEGLPNRRQETAPTVSVAFTCDDGTQMSMALPVGALQSLSEQELLVMLTMGIRPA